MADSVDFFSNERWIKSHQYQTLEKWRQEFFRQQAETSGIFDVFPALPSDDVEFLRLCRHLNLEWMLQELEAWKKYWGQKLKNEIRNLIPNSNYEISYVEKERKKEAVSGVRIYTPEEGRQFADQISNVIIEHIHEILHQKIDKYSRLPIGGNIGNYAKFFDKDGQVDCGDWSTGLNQALSYFISSAKNYSFEIHFVRTALVDSLDINQHHWIQIYGPDREKYVTVDPWPSGGRMIIPEKKYIPKGIISINNNKTKYGEDFETPKKQDKIVQFFGL